MDSREIVLKTVKECTSFITPRRLSKKLGLSKKLINYILHCEEKTDKKLKKDYISRLNNRRKRPIWFFKDI